MIQVILDKKYTYDNYVEALVIDDMIKSNEIKLEDLAREGFYSEAIECYKEYFVNASVHIDICTIKDFFRPGWREIVAREEERRKGISNLIELLDLDRKDLAGSLYDIVLDEAKLQKFISTLRLKTFW